MSTLGANVLTLADWAKRLDPDGKVPSIVELLNLTNEVLDDMLWKEGNLPTGERTSVRTGLPTAYWRLLNQAVQTSKSTTAQIDEGVGMLEAFSEVDRDLAMLNGNTAAFRLSEAQAFIEAMNQAFCTALFYGNSGINPEQFNGLAIRYSSLSSTNASNVITAAGSGSDNSSIYLVCWGANSIHGIFPKGSVAGLMHEDLGLLPIQGSTGIGGTKLMAYLDHWQWKCGIALKDWRYVVRIPNIDISNLVTKSTPADLPELMIKATHRIPNLQANKPVFYMNRSCFQMLDIQRRDDVQSGGSLSYDVVDGKRIPMFRGIPIKIVDALTETEAAVA